MAKKQLKTKKTEESVEAFLNAVKDEHQRADSQRLTQIMARLSDEPPKMWGSSIIGFGSTLVKYASGRELDWMKIGFSPRKSNLSLYISCDLKEHSKLLEKLGTFKTGVGCLYIKRLSDIDEKVLEKMINAALRKTRNAL